MSEERNDGIQDADLHAYLDGELDADRRLAVEAHLARHPSDRARLESWRAQQAALHRQFDAVLAEPVPAALGELPAFNPAPRPWRLAAMLALVAVMAGSLGWALGQRQAQPVPALAHLVAPAAFAHRVYATDPKHPVEFDASRSAQLAAWVSERMHAPIAPPDLTAGGFRLVGGRLLPSTNRMAAQFLYEDDAGRRVSLYVRRADWKATGDEFHYRELDGLGVFYWTRGEMAHALAGRLPRAQLIELAARVQAAG